MTDMTFPYNAQNVDAFRRNPAIRLYGNRFSIDQTSIELLSEFFLVACSAKKIGDDEVETYFPSYETLLNWDNEKLKYAPTIRLNLKLFSFLSASRIDSRHVSHRKHHSYLIGRLKEKIDTKEDNENEIIKTLENLLMGLQAAGYGRTWCAQSFLPICKNLIAGEAIWAETKAAKAGVQDWDEIFITNKRYFETNKHIFYARGGELLYLQLCNGLQRTKEEIRSWSDKIGLDLEEEELDPSRLLSSLENGFDSLFKKSPQIIGKLANFIDEKLDKETSVKTDGEADFLRYVEAGWCNANTWQEGYLLAVDIVRILKSDFDIIESIHYLETLFVLHNLRTLAMQSSRQLDESKDYYMAVTSASEEDGALKRISHQSLKSIEKKIYYAINDFFENQDYEKDQKYLNEASRRSGHKLFLNLAKKIDFVIPKKGSGARFVMTPEVLKLLVAITVPENGRITYDTFKEIIKSRWGMVFDNRGFSECNKSINGSEIYIDSNVDAWLIEMLDESGLLVHLSDSCALVLHPKQD